VLGDSVNLASRIQNLASSYGLRILICPETAARCQDALAIVAIDDVRVRGRKHAVTVHTILGGSDLLRDPEFRSFRSAFESMRAHYRRGEWKQAMNALETSRQHYTNPRIYRLLDIYESRIAALKRHSTLHRWNGVFSDMFPGETGSLSADQNWTTTQS
jgi:adenylate cyclase